MDGRNVREDDSQFSSKSSGKSLAGTQNMKGTVEQCDVALPLCV